MSAMSSFGSWPSSISESTTTTSDCTVATLPSTFDSAGPSTFGNLGSLSTISEADVLNTSLDSSLFVSVANPTVTFGSTLMKGSECTHTSPNQSGGNTIGVDNQSGGNTVGVDDQSGGNTLGSDNQSLGDTRWVDAKKPTSSILRSRPTSVAETGGCPALNVHDHAVRSGVVEQQSDKRLLFKGRQNSTPWVLQSSTSFEDYAPWRMAEKPWMAVLYSILFLYGVEALLGWIPVVSIILFNVAYTTASYMSWRITFQNRATNTSPEILPQRSVSSPGGAIRRSDPMEAVLARNKKFLERLDPPHCDTVGGNSEMDFMHITFLQYLWTKYFVSPSAYYLSMSALLVLETRKFLIKYGIMSRTACQREHVIADLLLETGVTLNFVDITTKDGIVIGEWQFNSYPVISQQELVMKDHTTILVDLTNRKWLKTTMDGKQRNAQDTLLVVFYWLVAIAHPGEHTHANWASNVRHPDPIVRRMSTITIIYNNMGIEGFPWFTSALTKLGVFEFDFGPHISTSVQYGVGHGVPSHKNIEKLIPYSGFIRFLGPLRLKFKEVFAQYAACFANIDGDALFNGIVVHGVDHSQATKYVPDALFLEEGSEEFRDMRQVCRVIRACFVPRLPGLLFRRTFQHLPHPFYQDVFKMASKIDGELAREIEACIVR